LSYGDLILIHAFGMTYTYEVREEYLVVPEDISTVFQSELLDWVTLVTCEFFDPESEQYQFRRIVHAVLVNVE